TDQRRGHGARTLARDPVGDQNRRIGSGWRDACLARSPNRPGQDKAGRAVDGCALGGPGASCMTQQPTIDGADSKLGDCEFNKDENWEGGRVPDGTGTVYASNCLNNRLTFSQRITTLGALRLLQGTGIELAAGQTLNLGQGIYANSGGYQLELR